MELSERIKGIEEEVNLIKIEIRTVLVDIRDELLKRSGPFPVSGDGMFTGFAIDESVPAAVGLMNEPVELSAPVAPSPLSPVPDLRMEPEPMARPAVPHHAAAQPHFAEPPREAQPESRGDVAMAGADKAWGVLDIASLGKWAEGATRRVGRKRLEELLGVYELLTGKPEASAKQAVLRMLDLCGATTEPDSVSMNDLLTVLSQLDALFRSSSITEVTVLSLLAEAA
jgi:hypothetical protein